MRYELQLLIKISYNDVKNDNDRDYDNDNDNDNDNDYDSVKIFLNCIT